MPKITLVFAVLLILVGVVGYVGSGGKAAPSGGAAENAAKTGTDGSAGGGGAPGGTETKDAPKRSLTALIPSFVGVLLAIFGLAAMKEEWRKHAMHGAVLIGLLGALAAGGRGAMSLVKLMGGADVNMRSLMFLGAMFVLCGVYVGLCVNSFIQARKRQREADATAKEGT